MKKKVVLMLMLGLVITQMSVGAKEVSGGKMVMERYYCKEKNTEAPSQESSKIINNRKESIREYKNIIKEVKKENKYDKKYAGAYMNAEQELVVLTKKGTKGYKNKIREVSGNDNILFEDVKYSYDELEKVYNKIVEGMENDSETDINSVYIDEMNNCIVVNVDDDMTTNSEEVCDLIENSELIKLETGGELAISASKSVYPGQKIAIGNFNYSMGFRASYTSTSG